MTQVFSHMVLYYKFQDLATKENKKNFNEIKILCLCTKIDALNP